jgi:hypothetical protein
MIEHLRHGPIEIEELSMKDEAGGSGKRPTRAYSGSGGKGGGMSGGGMGGKPVGMGPGRPRPKPGGAAILAQYWPAVAGLSLVVVAVGMFVADPFRWFSGGAGESYETAESGQAWWPPMVAIRYDEFHQPEMIRALHAGDTQLDSVVVRIPRNAPSFFKSQDLGSRGQRTTKKIYALQLVIALENLAMEEKREYLPEGTPLLKSFVHADVAGEARVRLESDSEPLVSQLSQKAVDWAKVASTLLSVITTDLNNGAPGVVADANREARRVSNYIETLEKHAAIDAVKLMHAYYDGHTEAVENVYATVGEYVLGEPIWQMY